MSFGSFIEPLNILGFPGFQGQITYGSSTVGPLDWYVSFPYYIIGTQYDPFPNYPLIDRRDLPTTDLEVPVGSPEVQPVPEITGNELPDLGDGAGPVEILATVDRGAEPMTQAEIDAYFAAYGFPPFPGATASLPTAPTGEADMAGVFDDLGEAYNIIDEVIFGGGLPGGYVAPAGSSTQNFLPVDNTGVTGVVLPPGGPPPGGTVGTCGPTGPTPVWKKVCGVYKWVTPKRRRRRALLTESDYNALLRIEGLKVNKNMTVAIAKALTR